MRSLLLISAALLLTSCTVSSGIVDHWAPPQAQPVVDAVRPACAPTEETTSPDATGQDVTRTEGVLLPCAAETIAAAVSGKKNQLPPPQRPRSGRRLPLVRGFGR
jgi:hypothetical protein